MVVAVLVAVAIMLLAANPLGNFIDANPTIKMLALAFILLVGVVLVLDGFDVHVPKPYFYYATSVSAIVELLYLHIRLDSSGNNAMCPRSLQSAVPDP